MVIPVCIPEQDVAGIWTVRCVSPCASCPSPRAGTTWSTSWSSIRSAATAAPSATGASPWRPRTTPTWSSTASSSPTPPSRSKTGGPRTGEGPWGVTGRGGVTTGKRCGCVTAANRDWLSFVMDRSIRAYCFWESSRPHYQCIITILNIYEDIMQMDITTRRKTECWWSCCRVIAKYFEWLQRCCITMLLCILKVHSPVWDLWPDI